MVGVLFLTQQGYIWFPKAHFFSTTNDNHTIYVENSRWTGRAIAYVKEYIAVWTANVKPVGQGKVMEVD